MSLHLLIGICVTLSIITFLVYALDKTAASQRRWRIPENFLHLLALLGGWPGALAAQQMLRHKTRKFRFQVLFWITILLNLGLVWYPVLR